MNLSKRSKASFFLPLFLLGCTTSSYKVVDTGKNKDVILVTPNRVILDCSDVGSDEGSFYGFSIFVLDNNNMALSVVQTNKLDKDSCEKRINKIGKILKQGLPVYIYGIGDPNEPSKIGDAHYTFPGLGTYPENGKVLQFIYILNKSGACYDAYSADKKPCPQD